MAQRSEQRGDGDGWVDCGCGARHWGRFGAAGLLLFDPRRGVLLQHRAHWGHHGNTWGVPGGARDSAESAPEAALREAREEAAVPANSVLLTAESTMEHESWSYTTLLATTSEHVEARAENWESKELRWVSPEEVERLPLLPAFGEAWPALRQELGSEVVLVVDAANVMGAIPDGWWRDRAGAAARLRDRLAALSVPGNQPDSAALGTPPAQWPPQVSTWRWWPRVVLVVEGQAKRTDATTGVEVVAATKDGDSAIVDVAHDAAQGRARVLVATSDQELRRRISAVGARPMSPRALLNLLPARG